MLPTTNLLGNVLQETRRLEFLRPTTRLRKLLLLSELHNEPKASQRNLAERAGVSVSVANQYLGGFLQEALTTRRPVNRRDFEYTLTEDGNAHLTEQVLRYLREIFVLSNGARNEIAQYLSELLQGEGIRQIAVYPAGEVAETILHALDALEVGVVGVVDDDPNLQGRRFHGRVVAAPEELTRMAIDAVLVATYRHRPQVLSRLREISLPDAKVVCL